MAVTRIIAGAAGSLPLAVPGSGTRPTADRVRESLFGSLAAADRIVGARVLDLFAGSGALGLEALSRGASRVDLVERAPRAVAIATRNADKVAAAPGVHGSVRVHREGVDAYLRAAADRFDLVFADPPYDLDDDALRRSLALLEPRLEAGAVVIVERAARSAEPVFPESVVAERSRRYGDTVLWWARAR